MVRACVHSMKLWADLEFEWARRTAEALNGEVEQRQQVRRMRDEGDVVIAVTETEPTTDLAEINDEWWRPHAGELRRAERALRRRRQTEEKLATEDPLKWPFNNKTLKWIELVAVQI
nr:unnamed protein product [Digitaria exilis]